VEWLIHTVDPNALWAELQLAFLFGSLAVLICFFSWKRGYFSLPKSFDPPLVNLLHLLSGFAFYLIFFFYLSPKLSESLKNWIPIERDKVVSYISWINFSTLLLSSLFILVFYGLCFPKVLSKILKRSDSPLYWDLCIGLLSWIISFPIVVFFSELLDIFVIEVFKVTELPEQLAIQYLLSTVNYPLFLAIALISIIFLAPFVEEFMFRGLLQNWLRRHLGVKKAVIITAFLFSFFHYSPSQGLGNISIVGSLFVLACFLGFVYERQRSLFASMMLHSTFNLISILNLLLKG
jgi:uncharacterized protein